MTDLLADISAAVRGRKAYRRQVEIEAAEWVRSKMVERDQLIEKLVIQALDRNYKVVEIAEAYTVSGKTPNRNAIHEIKRRHGIGAQLGDIAIKYPFEWRDRTVTTVNGEVVRWDLYAYLEDFGPENITGQFWWKFIGGELDPVLADNEPYPSSKYYQAVLGAWLAANPYPGESE